MSLRLSSRPFAQFEKEMVFIAGELNVGFRGGITCELLQFQHRFAGQQRRGR